MTCTLAPQTPAEKRAQSLKPVQCRTPVEINQVGGLGEGAAQTAMACFIINAKRAANTSLGRAALASASVERCAGQAPRW